MLRTPEALRVYKEDRIFLTSNLEKNPSRDLQFVVTPDPVYFGSALMDTMHILGSCLSKRGRVVGQYKLYSEHQHGEIPRDDLGEISITTETETITKLNNMADERDLDVVTLSTIFKESTTNKTFIIPAVDLEIISSGSDCESIKADLGGVANKLMSINCSGFFFRSGCVGRGGYYYLADFAMPYTPSMWTFPGEVMELLIDVSDGSPEANQNIALSIELGNKLQVVKDVASAQEVAREIMLKFPSVPLGADRPGLLHDPRWIGHNLLEEKCNLRISKAKGYSEPPIIVGEIR